MVTDPFFQAVLFGSLIALGIGFEHMRIRWAMKRKKQHRRQYLGMGYRKEVEPQLGRWTPDHGKAAWR
jgi:hypothetical protein